MWQYTPSHNTHDRIPLSLETSMISICSGSMGLLDSDSHRWSEIQPRKSMQISVFLPLPDFYAHFWPDVKNFQLMSISFMNNSIEFPLVVLISPVGSQLIHPIELPRLVLGDNCWVHPSEPRRPQWSPTPVEPEPKKNHGVWTSWKSNIKKNTCNKGI